MFAPPASIPGSVPEMEDDGQLDEDEDEELDDVESEGDGHDYDGEGPSWVGFDDAGLTLKPPL